MRRSYWALRTPAKDPSPFLEKKKVKPAPKPPVSDMVPSEVNLYRSVN